MEIFFLQRHTSSTTEYSYDKTPNYLSPVIKALRNQPALAYFLFSGVTSSFSVNNIPHTKDIYGEKGLYSLCI